MNTVKSKIIGTETIECPECGSHEKAEIEGDIFFASYLHECKKCGYLIMESEWQPVEQLAGAPMTETMLSPTEQEDQALLLWCEICPDRRVSLIQTITPDSPGMRSGLPRFYLPVASGQFRGLYLEMPATVQTLSKEQTTWLRVLSEQGHKVNFCANSAQAIDAILNYLRIEGR